MARLSASPFPASKSKSNILTGIFKSTSRPSFVPNDDSESVSSSPSATGTKLKKGFSKVGLFPSDRVSSGGSMEAQRSPTGFSDFVAKQEQELKGTSAPHAIDTDLHSAAAMPSPAPNPASPAHELADTANPAIKRKRSSPIDGSTKARQLLGLPQLDTPATASTYAFTNTPPKTAEFEIVEDFGTRIGYVPVLRKDSTTTLETQPAPTLTDETEVLPELLEPEPKSLLSSMGGASQSPRPSPPSPPLEHTLLHHVLPGSAIPTIKVNIGIFTPRVSTVKLGPLHLEPPLGILFQYITTFFYLGLLIYIGLGWPTQLPFVMWDLATNCMMYAVGLHVCGWWDADVPDAMLTPVMYGFGEAGCVAVSIVGRVCGRVAGAFLEGFGEGYEEGVGGEVGSLSSASFLGEEK